MLFGSAKGNQKPGKEARSIKALSKEYPELTKVLEQLGVPTKNSKASLAYICEEAGVDPADVFDILDKKEAGNIVSELSIQSLTILPGTNKQNKQEYGSPIHIHSGEIIALVGPTGSGKSQILNDIEGLAQGDSPSGRKILFNDKEVDDELRFNHTYKPIAQISQNMNYLIDLPVSEFIDMHFDYRGKQAKQKEKDEILSLACSLSGEDFSANTPLVALSGGQARALMIADAIKIGCAPIILVDEIENAGINKIKAIELLLKSENITFIATHDPLIALMAHKRFILKNGGISDIVERSEKEMEVLEELKQSDLKMSELRNQLRSGQQLLTGNIQ